VVTVATTVVTTVVGEGAAVRMQEHALLSLDAGNRVVAGRSRFSLLTVTVVLGICQNEVFNFRGREAKLTLRLPWSLQSVRTSMSAFLLSSNRCGKDMLYGLRLAAPSRTSMLYAKSCMA
jgi:hypothetical protein